MEPITAARDERWTRAARAADMFRGGFVHLHARGEASISEALLALSEASASQSVSLPHLGGQRLAELRRVVDTRKKECSHMPHVISVLDGFQRFERLRGFICHGVATLVLDQRNQWGLGYKLLCFKSKAAVRETIFLTQDDAAALLTELEAAVDRLCPALRHVHKLAKA